MRRKVLAPFTLLDNISVPARNWTYVPRRAVMCDPANYPDPDVFNGFCFVNGNANVSKAKHMDVESKLSLWGLGKRI